MSVYEEFRVYGPYKRKDGRQHVVLIKHDFNNHVVERKTVSYPKFLVETYLNKYLDTSETVDHIDGNFDNNELSNLRVVERSIHCRSHANFKPEVKKQCVICGKIFYTRNNHRITCGDKHCNGKCSHINGYNKGNSFIREKNNLVCNRSLVQEIESVETANSVKPLVGNTEQGV